MDITRNQRLISCRRAVDADRLDGQTLFLKKSPVVGHKHGKRRRREQGDCDANLFLRRHASDRKAKNQREYHRGKRELHGNLPPYAYVISASLFKPSSDTMLLSRFLRRRHGKSHAAIRNHCRSIFIGR
jgi:hypothetical protein